MIHEFQDTVESMIKAFLRDFVSAAIPGKVVATSNYQDRQFVDVEITVSRKYHSGKTLTEDGSTIYGVPFINPGAGNGVLTFPVKVNDSILLIPNMRDIENWKVGDGVQQVDASEPRYCSRNDMVAIPGLCTVSNHLRPHPDNVELKFGDILFSLKPDGTVLLTNGSVSYTMNPDGSTVETNGSGTKTLQSNGVFNINGFIINTDGSASSPVSVTAPLVDATTSLLAAGDEVVEHTHTQGKDSDGNTQQTTDPI